MLKRSEGFTVVEVIVALLILSVAVLGVAGSTTSLTTAAVSAEQRAAALYSVQDRIARIEADGRYATLDSLYAGVDSGVPAPGYVRTTTVQTVSVTNPTPLDYTRITVSVIGPGLTAPIERSLLVAAP